MTVTSTGRIYFIIIILSFIYISYRTAVHATVVTNILCFRDDALSRRCGPRPLASRPVRRRARAPFALDLTGAPAIIFIPRVEPPARLPRLGVSAIWSRDGPGAATIYDMLLYYNNNITRDRERENNIVL